MPTALPPLKLEPQLRILPWGTERWMVSDLPGAESRVAGGPLAGESLRALMAGHAAELLGSALPAPDGRFPLLFKLLDAREPLSVQVHPDEDAAARLGRGARPKTEAWYVLFAAPGAEVVLGLQPGTGLAELKAAFGEAGLAKLLWRVRARAGDFFYLPAGLVHSIGAGLRLAEIQQVSDTTYRLHDWGRLGLDGAPRPLHREEALASIRTDLHGPVAALPPPSGRPGVRGPSFCFERLDLDPPQAIELPAGAPRILACLSGALKIHSAAGRARLAVDEVVLLPAALGARLAADGHTAALLATGGGRGGGGVA